MREELLPFIVIGALVALFAVPAALLFLLERVPGFRPGDGPQTQPGHSRSGGIVMIVGGAAVCVVTLLSWGWSYLSAVAPLGVGLLLIGASGFARDERRSQWLDRAGRGLMLASIALLWLVARP